MRYIIIFLLFNLFSFGQSKIKTYNEHISFANKIEAETFAKEDIKNNSIFIYLKIGWGPMVYNTDKDFETKYNIQFNDEGCTGSKFSIYYNFIIYAHLSKNFGKKWEKEIRKDVIGFKEWKKTNK
ncbi:MULTISPECIES: hypothetical protein [Flavobacterium]|uniref:Uncharacterized protein n=1 Tax=Flavobacterium hankyongi TaxID=1176532 RepID=A0ABP9A2H5_9FLAO|nr:hypothetical protein [Flavobacterium sp. N1846]